MATSKRKPIFFSVKGFTLVELMIVVAIIGILASIAILQFAAYRIRGFNASALSDTRNMRTSEVAMFAGLMSYGGSDGPVAAPLGVIAYAGFAGGAGKVITGPPVLAGSVNTLTWTDANINNVGTVVGLGNGVSLIVSTEVPVPPVISLSSFTIIGKHFNGDTYFGGASDTENIYQDQVDGSEGTILAPIDAVASTITKNDFVAPVVGPSGNGWVVK
ncbi:MAG: prepilin-type N-terminal cleavage/methylation domain-containing protein [Pseudomonadota bacterium]